MKKLLIINNSLARGGAERVTVYLADYMVKNGVPCDILTETISKNEYDVPDGVQRLTLKAKKYFSKVREIRRVIKNSGVDTVLVMGVPNSIYVVPATCGLKVKVIISERNDPNHFLGNPLVKKYSRLLMRFADGFVFQNQYAKDFYKKKLKGRGEVIFNPLFTDGLPEVYTGERRKEFVNLGRLHEQKNQEMLINAFSTIAKKHEDFTLTIYGEGKLKDKLQLLINEKGLTERVTLAGNRSNVLELIKDSYAFVLSSDFEGMPNALIEAMSKALPCVGLKTGGIPELIDEKYVCSRKGNISKTLMKKALEISDKEEMKFCAKVNFEKSKDYDKKILDKKRIDFYKEFAQSINKQ